MLRFDEKFSPRLRFCIGFICCPLLTWLSAGLFFVLRSYADQGLTQIGPNVPEFVYALLSLSQIVFLCGLPILSGFWAAFFWRRMEADEITRRNGAVWSVALAWLPAIFYAGQSFFLLLPLLPFVFLIFLVSVVLYSCGLWKGHEFWNSARPRQWFGDFSDLDISDTAIK